MAIAHLSYVVCDCCGTPAECGDDAKEARILAANDHFVRNWYTPPNQYQSETTGTRQVLGDFCRDCADPNHNKENCR